MEEVKAMAESAKRQEWRNLEMKMLNWDLKLACGVSSLVKWHISTENNPLLPRTIQQAMTRTTGEWWKCSSFFMLEYK